MILTSGHIRETKKIAEQFAKKALKMRFSNATVLALEGDLGAGKTTFAQGFAKGLGIRKKIKSPTFVLLKKYPLKKVNLFHIDSYRLSHYTELLPLGIKEIFSDRNNIVLIEWADKIKKIIPKNATWLRFEHLDGNRRRIHYKSNAKKNSSN
jgi:tRNA threonylcarbamoyladenosine biosynthesis protein TsaE